MSPRRRCALALVVTALVLAGLRIAAPDPTTRREWALGVMLPLGFGHQIAAVACRRRRPRRRLERVLGYATLASSGVSFAWLLTGPAAVPLLAALAAVAVWHGIENERAMARAAAPNGNGRLAPLSRSPREQTSLLLATGLGLAAIWGLPQLAHAALRWGAPAGLCAWTAEELMAALLFHHIVSFLIFHVVRPAGIVVRSGSGARLVLSHVLPIGLAFASYAWWPALFAFFAAPTFYLFCSFAHALDTSRARGLAPG